MANGDFRLLDQHILAIKLLDAQTAAADGVWVEMPAQYNIRSFWTDITTETSGSPKIEIMVSNAITKPADATSGVVIHTLDPATPTSLAATSTTAYRWVKAKKTAGGTPVATTCIVESARNE